MRDKLLAKFEGWPDTYLTAALIFAAIVVLFIAWKAHPAFKAVALAYVALP